MDSKRGKVRLNKYLSERGICSRREADRLAAEGKITVNGVPAQPGMQVSSRDVILVNGKKISRAREKSVVLAVNKPRGVVCTTAEFKNEKNIVDLVSYPVRVYPIGRLDKTSEGLILMTNDGDTAETVEKSRIEKEYVVTVDRAVTEEMLNTLRHGVYLPDLDVTTRPCSCTRTGENVFHIILTEGLNREIRRMCETLHLHVRRLKRVRIGNIELGDIPLGKYRELSEGEIKRLIR